MLSGRLEGCGGISLNKLSKVSGPKITTEGRFSTLCIN